MPITNPFPAKATKRAAIGLWGSTTHLLVTCFKHTNRVVRRLSRPDLRSVRPKQLLTVINNKTNLLWQKRKGSRESVDIDGCDDDEFGVWQRSILMGEKCEPLDFSGVLFYDSNGEKIDELPMKSPRLSPLPGKSLGVICR